MAIRSLLATSLCLVVSCASNRPGLQHDIKVEKRPAAGELGAVDPYIVRCPDVLELVVPDRPQFDGRHTIDTEGRIDFGKLGRPRVEGQTIEEVARTVAAEADVPQASVQVHVAEYRSQKLYLFGQIKGLQHSIPYEGPETVMELLQRIGVTPGAARGHIYIVRSGLLEGAEPQVFHIDMRGILERKNQHTNLRLMPFDQVYIGETRQSRNEKAVPPLFRPIYEFFCGLRSTDAPEKSKAASETSKATTD